MVETERAAEQETDVTMATIPLTVLEYNDARIRSALAARPRDEPPRRRIADPAPMVQYRVASGPPSESSDNRVVTGRGFVTPGPLTLAGTAVRLRQARPGGRPRRHETRAARQRAYRARRRLGLAPAVRAR